MTEQEFDERVKTYGRIAHNAANEARPELEKSVDVILRRYGVESEGLTNELVNGMIYCTELGAQAMIKPALRIRYMKD